MKIPSPDDIFNYGVSLTPYAGIVLAFMVVVAFIKGCGH